MKKMTTRSEKLRCTSQKPEDEVKEVTTARGPRFKSFCRIRPFDRVNNSFFKFTETNSNITRQVLSVNRSAIYSKEIENLGNKFYFDYIFDEEFTQVEVFHETCLNLIDNLVEKRKSSLIMAHGLNDSGKSYTIVGDSENPGILPLSLRYMFDMVKQKNNDRIQIFCNYVELHDEFVYDLLGKQDNVKVNILNNAVFNIISGAHYYPVKILHDLTKALNMGERRKRMKNKTSLSYTIFKIILQFHDVSKQLYEECSISFIDFAFPVGKEFLLIDSKDNSKSKDLKNNVNLYKMHSSFCKVLSEFVSINKEIKPKLVQKRRRKVAMHYCPLLQYIKYFIYGDEEIVLISNIKPSFDKTEENMKVLYFANRFALSIENVDKYHHQIKAEKFKKFKIKPDLNLIDEDEDEDEEDIIEKKKEEPKPGLYKSEPKSDSSKVSSISPCNHINEFEQIKKNMQELMIKFEEQQMFFKTLFENEMIVSQKDNFVSSNELIEGERLKELTSNSRLFNIILIRPKINKLVIQNSNDNSACQQEEKREEGRKIEANQVYHAEEVLENLPQNQDQESLPTKIIANISQVEEKRCDAKETSECLLRDNKLEPQAELECSLPSTYHNSEKTNPNEKIENSDDEELEYFKLGANYKRNSNVLVETKNPTMKRTRKKNN